MTKRTLKLSTAALALAVGLTSFPVYAQDADDDIIIVTAQRREQSLAETPVAVSVFDGAELELTATPDITAIAQVTPNVTFEVSRGTNSTLTAFIRGVGQQDPVAGFEAGVGLYIDDIYLNRPQAAVLDIYDVERIEVLRGPQGTLYGRNTIGGAIKYVTKRLDDEPTAKARIAAGSYNQFDGVVSGSLPITDNFRVGGAYAMYTRDGFGENLNLPNTDNYDKDVRAFRLSAEWEPTDNLFFRASYDRTDDDSAPRQGHRLLPSGTLDANGQPLYPVLDNEFDTRAGLNVIEQAVNAEGYSLTGEWAVNETITLKSITAYREDESTTPIDFDSLPVADLDVPAIYTNEQFSQEFQFAYTSDRLNGLVGVYYLDANASTVFDVLLAQTLPTVLPGLNAQTFGDVDTETWAVFADFTYDVTDRLAVSVGGRYTEDDRSSIVKRNTYIFGFSEFFGGNPVLFAETSDFEGSASFDKFTPRVNVAYELTPDHNGYLSYSQGFKGGGFDPRGQTSATPDFNQDGMISDDEIYRFMSFDPETVNSYEAGLKSSWADGRVRTNAAVFYSDYQDVQIPGSVGFDTDGDGINDTFAGVTTNAAAATIWGVELEGWATVAEDMFKSGDEFDFNWTLGYIDAEYDEYIGPAGNDISNDRVVQNTPDWTASAVLDYSVPLGLGDYPGDLSVINTVSYRGDSSQFEIPIPQLDQDAYTLWDLSIIWQSADGRYNAGLHGKNLTDERYIVSGYDFEINTVLGIENNLTGFYGNPRTVTATVGVNF